MEAVLTYRCKGMDVENDFDDNGQPVETVRFKFTCSERPDVGGLLDNWANFTEAELGFRPHLGDKIEVKVNVNRLERTT